MKMLIALTIFGILTYAIIQVSSANKICHRDAIENFDLEKYLKMKLVYVTHKQRSINRHFCQVMNITKHSNGTIVNISGGYKLISGTTHYSKMYCSADKENVGQGKFSYNCHFLVDSQNRPPNCIINTTVIDTDYQNYVILYGCSKTRNICHRKYVGTADEFKW
uniref:Putative pallidipin-like salivary lipocalin n=1 Tax=Panstrongylus lignarius TaxID=156445 RepID=A0A224Y017_9HEMI